MKRIRNWVAIVIIALSFGMGISQVGCSKSPTAPKERIGAVCNDGTRSTATGSGACSHHGGVDYWLYKD